MVKAMAKTVVKGKVFTSRQPGPKGRRTDNDSALDYIRSLKETMDLEEFVEFCKILKAYRLRGISLSTVRSRIKRLFKRHSSLILSLIKKYLPRENMIVVVKADLMDGEVLA
ncbi:hypothetical protein R1flu_001653 [Riccia fluitans]|uniref:LAGLIDADG homing endonuclease n=1 Tax=Riccia fluitans TaxID=41844 RepID=A0ABD1Y3W1_9MARC